MAPAQKFDVARDDVEADLLRSGSLPARLEGIAGETTISRHVRTRCGWLLSRAGRDGLWSASARHTRIHCSQALPRRRNERSVKLLASDHTAIKRLGLLVRFGIDPVHRNRHSRLG